MLRCFDCFNSYEKKLVGLHLIGSARQNKRQIYRSVMNPGNQLSKVLISSGRPQGSGTERSGTPNDFLKNEN
jgi:hypothetical protein